MDHSVNLTELKDVVGKFIDQHNLVVSGGPLAVSGLLRAVVTKNKAVSMAVGGSAAWFAVKELSEPVLGLIQDQFGQLQHVFGLFR